MHRSVFLYIPLLCLLALSINCPFVLSAEAQTCGGAGVAVQVLGSGGPELQDKRASSLCSDRTVERCSQGGNDDGRG
jgi:hypothetical protein